MEVALAEQGRRLLSALLLGLGLGLLYDLLRPPRRRFPRLGAPLDMLFGLLAGAAAFVFALSAGGGRPGLWELGASLLGFLLYLHALSPPLLPVLEKSLNLLCAFAGGVKNFFRNCAKSAKILFQKMRK